jgi:hypothetical protein
MSRSSSAASTSSTAGLAGLESLHQQQQQQQQWGRGGSMPGQEPGRTANGTFQAWALQRPPGDERGAALTRRALRRLGRAWTLEEVAAHRTAGDAWIAVAGRVGARALGFRV